LGAIVARIMAHETAEANETGLRMLELAPDDRLLEVGFGHGRTLQKAMAFVNNGIAVGVDHSAVMLRAASRRNRQSLRAGNMELKLADAERIPYPDGRFNKVLSVHTIYFWSAPQRQLDEIFRVTVPGGRFVLGHCPRENALFAANFPSSVYHIRSLSEVEALVAASGFRVVETSNGDSDPHVMVWTVAERP
jgi:ubiquinone/menaquinone biosynthesis C-methylase UbiE